MLQGTADVDVVAAKAPLVATPSSEPLSIPKAELLQVAWEVTATDRDALLPPALHPVNPPVVTFSFTARQGVHPRPVHARRGPPAVSQWDPDPRVSRRRPSSTTLKSPRSCSTGWGYRIAVADVTMSHRYDGATGRVAVDGVVALRAGHVSPCALSPSDLQYTSTMHPARLDRGLRLLQVERDYQFVRAERGDPFVDAFDADAWGEPRLRLSHPVSASSAVADVAFKPVRFVCRADVWAFDGTEPLAADAPLTLLHAFIGGSS